MDLRMSTDLLAAAELSFGWWERLSHVFRYEQTPLVVSTLVGAILGLCGCFVVLRRMALIGDALSHAVLPGVVIAFIVINALVGKLEGAAGVWGLFAGALIAGLLTSGGINLIARFSRAKEDAAIGIAFTAMFALGVILISNLPAGTHFDLKCFLFGEVLAVQREDLITTLIVAPCVVGLILLFYRPLKLISFDPQMAAASGVPVTFLHYMLMGLLSLTVVAALRSVGVIMAVAMLITPAAIAYQLTNRFSIMLILATAAGALSSSLGFLLAFQFSTPPGPMMVLVATGLFVATMALSPEYGILAKSLRRRRLRRHILEEDVLKSMSKLAGTGDRTAIAGSLGRAAEDPMLGSAMLRLEREGMLSGAVGSAPQLTEAGRERAELLVRSHRLWETYLAEHNVPHDRLHDIAEHLEHAHDVAEEVADELGHPDIDPHGEPIPAPPRQEE